MHEDEQMRARQGLVQQIHQAHLLSGGINSTSTSFKLSSNNNPSKREGRCDWRSHDDSSSDAFGNSSFGNQQKRQKKTAGENKNKVKTPLGTVPVPLYWINMDHSLQRREFMEKQLQEIGPGMGVGLSTRVSAVVPNSPAFNITMLEKPCKRNTNMDLAVILSHLTAMYRAVKDTSPVALASPYALIIEDDVRFPLRVNFPLLFQTAPKGFGILQLVTSNMEAVTKLWDIYTSSDMKHIDVIGQRSVLTRKLWEQSFWTNTTKDRKTPLFWSTQAYAIDKRTIRPFLDDVVDEHTTGLSFKLVNSFFPHMCTRKKERPCVLSNCLFADSYLYAGGGPTFVSTVPLANGARGVAMESTVHQAHVKEHKNTFDVIHTLVQQIKGDFENRWLKSSHTAVSNASLPLLPPYITPPRCY